MFIAAFQDFKVFLLLPHTLESSRSKKTFFRSFSCNDYKFEFRLNCNQRLTCHLGPMSDNRFMSVDAASFCLCKNPINFLLSMNKSARACGFCAISKT